MVKFQQRSVKSHAKPFALRFKLASSLRSDWRLLLLTFVPQGKSRGRFTQCEFIESRRGNKTAFLSTSRIASHGSGDAGLA
jgi:hypothetical protein